MRSSTVTTQQLQRLVSGLTDAEATDLLYDWNLWAREKQLAPAGDWDVWLILAGRGFGKTRTGGEYVRGEVTAGRAERVALIAPTAADARDVMVEGESGILATAHPNFRPEYQASKRRITWPNGAKAFMYSAEEPERLRGPQHDLAWADELCSWKYLETMDMLDFGLRLGKNPRKIITTTPKPIRRLIEMLKEPGVIITSGSTYENARNLPKKFFDNIVKRYEGTNLGAQELYAKILDDIEGALWTRAMFDNNRIKLEDMPPLRRKVVAVDPTVKKIPDKKSDECGIVVGGIGFDGICYVMNDLTIKASPNQWAQRVVNTYQSYECDRVIAETNNGGALVEMALRASTNGQNVSYKSIHASTGKIARAEPVSALYEQGLVKHVGLFGELEDECCTYDASLGQQSPNRLDALVWLLTELKLLSKQHRNAGPTGSTKPSRHRKY